MGATRLDRDRLAALDVSIRAPAMGATSGYALGNVSALVSIRAPAMGATDDDGATATDDVFQSAPRDGGDMAVLDSVGDSESFNPRPRDGGDPSPLRIASARLCFNPRPRDGGDAGPGPRTSD